MLVAGYTYQPNFEKTPLINVRFFIQGENSTWTKWKGFDP
jgi:hypothetical protein